MFLRDFAINFLCFCFSNKNIAITLWSLIETKNFRIKIIFGLPVSCNFDHKYKNNWRLRLLQSDQLKLIRTFCSVLFIFFKRLIKDRQYILVRICQCPGINIINLFYIAISNLLMSLLEKLLLSLAFWEANDFSQ